MKIEIFNFDIKKQIMMNVNNCIINEEMDADNICHFDKIFNKISYEELDSDMFLYKLWNKIKAYVKKYYEINKDKLNKILSFINEQLLVIENNKEINKTLLKTKENNNEK